MGGVIIGYEIGKLLKKETIFCERVNGKFTLRRGFNIKKGSRVLIIEDVITTGKSSLECVKLIKKSKAKKFKNMKLPNFNKAIDDRFPKNKWNKINKRPDVIIFEGWCVGARAETNKSLKKSINSMEKTNDQKLVWRKYVNQQLKTKYKKLYSQLNCMIYLKAKNFSLLQKWRLKQEHKLWLKTKKKGSHKIMSKGDVINFMQTYQRITQNMFKNMPKYASIILNLNSNHQIKTAVYKSK